MKNISRIGIYAVLVISVFFSISCKKCIVCPPSLGENKLLIDDLEGNIAADNGCGNGAECSITFVKKETSPADVYSGNQAMKITYDKSFGGYMFCARGFGLKPAMETPEEKLVWTVAPESIDFQKFNAFGFYIKGNNTNNTVAVDILDKDREIFRYIFSDDSSDWKEMVISFSQFISRDDYQPNWDKRNKMIDFPIVTYQFEPLEGTGKEIKGDIIIDAVHFAVSKAPAEKITTKETEASISEASNKISPEAEELVPQIDKKQVEELKEKVIEEEAVKSDILKKLPQIPSLPGKSE